MKYVFLTVVVSTFALNAMAMEDDNSTEPQPAQQISQKKPQLNLRTVMNPDGVSPEEWKAMFEGERRSIIEQEKLLNDYIELFNNDFEKCSPEQLESHSKTHIRRAGIDLKTCSLIQTNALDSIEDIKTIIDKLRWLQEVRLRLLPYIEGLHKRDFSPIYTVLNNCNLLLESFKTPLIPLQFAHAGEAHKNGIKGEGAKVLVIENSLISGHSFFKNNPKIKVNELLFSDDDRKECHGAHVTGIVHQMAPKAEIFVKQCSSKFNLLLSTPVKIINTSYSTPIPLVHMLSEEQIKEIKQILSERTCENYKFQMIDRIFEDKKQFRDTMKYISDFWKNPSQPLSWYEMWEVDNPATVIQKAMQKSYSDTSDLLKKELDSFKGKLRIASFGNSYKKKDWDCSTRPTLLLEDEFLDQTILVMNITRENKLRRSSNRPDQTVGDSIKTILKNIASDDQKLVPQKLQRIQNSSLCALGTDVWSAGAHDGYKWASGTSMAAPMVTGVAALIEGMYPDFSVKEIRECLLNSASREFVIGSGENETYVIDLPQDQIDLLNEKSFGSRQYMAFDPSQYGKGILDADAALKYAEFKAKSLRLPTIYFIE